MKRSEMLRIIEDILTRTDGAYPWDQSEPILEAIEGAGMRPPIFLQKRITPFWDYGRDIEVEELVPYPTEGWEAEYEKE